LRALESKRRALEEWVERKKGEGGRKGKGSREKQEGKEEEVEEN
jgi:hypothetical protein